MSTGYSQEKLPSETIRIGADFTSSLLNGESISIANVVVTCTNAITDDPAPSILLGAPTLTDNIISQKVTGGDAGDVYSITFSTGATNLGLSYGSEMNLVITDGPSSSLILVTRDEVKRQLQITDSSDDTLIDDQIIAASAYIRKRCGRDFVLQEYTETIRIEDGNVSKIQLSNWPVQLIKEIQVYDWNKQLFYDVTDSNYWDFLQEGYVWFTFDAPYSFFESPGKNVVTYKAGYAKIPDDLKKAAADLAVAFYRVIGREGLSDEKIGDYSYRTHKLTDFPPSVRREINEAFIEGVISRYMSYNLGFVEEECYEYDS